MTFDEFVASRRAAADLNAALGDDYADFYEPDQAGFVYTDTLHIQRGDDGNFHVELCGDSMFSKSLHECEVALYNFAVGEKLFEGEEVDPPGDVRRIVTKHAPPPIPLRTKDWSAWFDGEDEETRATGYGASELDAIADLLAEQAMREET